MPSIRSILRRIDGRGYKAYKELLGAEDTAGRVKLRVLRVQSDPFAPPSVVEACIPVRPIVSVEECVDASTAVEDLALRVLSQILSVPGGRMGEGKSGLLSVPRPAPIMVRRSASILKMSADPQICFKVWVGLPSRRRRILGGEAERLLLNILPGRIERAVERLFEERNRLSGWCKTWKNQEAIRAWLNANRAVAFIGDGSILPRKCGSCSDPLPGAVPFESPESLRVEIPLPYGTITGMTIREGLTVVVGPAFHGKTTLLEAIRHGVWNHIPGDGREYVITRRDAVYVRSENGRSVKCVDLRPWIVSLPGKKVGPECFTTADASGATSVAATIQEAVEAGSKLILVDEDETATNILHRDVWVEEYTGKRSLRTLPDLAGSMKKQGISIIIVASGAIPLLARADTIIVMDEFRPEDASNYKDRAAMLAEQGGLLRDDPYRMPRERRIRIERLPEKWKLRGSLLEARGMRETVDLGVLSEMLEEERQLETAVEAAFKLLGRGRPIPARRLSEHAGEAVSMLIENSRSPAVSEVRGLDVSFVVNRLPIVNVEGLPEHPSI